MIVLPVKVRNSEWKHKIEKANKSNVGRRCGNRYQFLLQPAGGSLSSALLPPHDFLSQTSIHTPPHDSSYFKKRVLHTRLVTLHLMLSNYFLSLWYFNPFFSTHITYFTFTPIWARSTVWWALLFFFFGCKPVRSLWLYWRDTQERGAANKTSKR